MADDEALRASDEDRERAAEALSAHDATGRLKHLERRSRFRGSEHRHRRRRGPD